MMLEVLELVGVNVDVVVARRGRILKEWSLIQGVVYQKFHSSIFTRVRFFDNITALLSIVGQKSDLVLGGLMHPTGSL